MTLNFGNFESDSMTIKRLEIALQKEDSALLKTAGYKLHEKFHAGHKFEYLPQLKQILAFIENENLEGEFYRMISLTIREIVASQEGTTEHSATFFEQQNVFGAQDEQNTPQEQEAQVMENSQSIAPPEGVFSSRGYEVNMSEDGFTSGLENTIEQASTPIVNETFDTFSGGDIFIYWEEKNSEITTDLLSDYRKTITSDASLSEFLAKFKTISNILDLDLSNMNRILSTMASLNKQITFATSSLNSNLWDRIKENGGESWDFLPIWDQINSFECIECDNKFISTKSPAAQCQSCGGSAFAQFNLNPLNLQRSLDALMNSKTWVLINPPVGDTTLETMFSIAFKNSKPDKICLLTHDNERKMYYKNMFYGCEIKSDYASIENFCEEFGAQRASVWG